MFVAGSETGEVLVGEDRLTVELEILVGESGVEVSP